MAEENASKEEQIGFHKGALSTLSKERQEMKRILQIVEQLMNMHVKELQNLGIDLTKESDKPIEDLVNEEKKQEE